jgi:Tfp pilus assembly protein PilP
MRSALTFLVGILLAAAAPALRAQATPAAPGGAKPAQSPAGKSASAPQTTKAPAPGTKSATQPATKTAATKTAAKKAPKPPKPPKPVETAVNPDAPKTEEERAARRDPFESLVMRQQAAKNASAILPPGKAGLQVSTLRLDGIVKAPNGMIAVVTNPQARTYFLREGDQLYDGRVEKIAMDGVSFHEIGKDAFGKPVERQVNKRIYSSAGEQQ